MVVSSASYGHDEYLCTMVPNIAILEAAVSQDLDEQTIARV